MVQGGATNAGSEYLAQGLVELIQGNDSLKEAAESFLKSENITDVDLADSEKVIELLNGDKSEEFLKAILEKLPEEERFKKLAEQIGKDRVMMEKLEALGSQLSIQGVIGGAAITALTGALAGTLAIGGVAGALMGGGLALAGLAALVAIAAIGYAIYQYRGEIKEGALDAGKAIKSLVKDLIDKLPTFRARKNNFAKLNSDLLEQHRKSTDNEEKATLNNKIEIIKMLQDKDQRSAIKELVEKEEIKDFLKENLEKLIGKGDSTHVDDDMEKLKGFMDDFLPKIMAIGEDKIEEVEKKVNEKVKEMKPKSQVDDPSSKQVSPKEEITKT